jgi:hypothetical protein
MSALEVATYVACAVALVTCAWLVFGPRGLWWER